jgi:hypothetical protein
MTHLRIIATFVIVGLGTVGSGWVHGRLANRWGDDSARAAAAERLEQSLPERLGPWRMTTRREMEATAVELLQSAAQLEGVYVNEQTGESVAVLIVVGPSGPISAHTPEICYGGQDYSMAGERRRITVQDQRGGTHSLWQLHALSQHIHQPDLQVIYGWSAGSAWDATDGPRFAFGGLPLLYKLQLHRAISPRRLDQETDPAQDFLARFLADIQPRLVKSSRLSRLAP